MANNKMNVNVQNVTDGDEEYVVARYCDHELWYYGRYLTFERATEVAAELGNGIVVTEERRMSSDKRLITCNECNNQQKHFIEDKRYKKGGYWCYGCKLNSDIFEHHAVDGCPSEYCSSAEGKEK